MTAPRRDRLQALIAEWRIFGQSHRSPTGAGYRVAFLECADQIEALLAAPEAEADAPIYPHTLQDGETDRLRLRCNRCGQSVSTPFYPVKTDTPDGGLIVRAWIECPECLEQRTPP